MASNLGPSFEISLDLGDEFVFVLVVAAAFSEAVDTGEGSAVWVSELPGPSLDRDSGASEASVVSCRC